MLTTNNFFKKISSKCGDLDESAVRGVYSAMARVMLEELKDNNHIILPKVGIFEIRSYSDKRRKAGITKYIYFLPSGSLDYYINS